MAKTNRTINKSWLTVGLVAAVLTLSACSNNDDTPMETESPVDAQTVVEQDATDTLTAVVGEDPAATGINDGMVVSDNDEIGVASADGMAVNDDVAVVTADDSEILDGTESSEHVSTY